MSWLAARSLATRRVPTKSRWRRDGDAIFPGWGGPGRQRRRRRRCERHRGGVRRGASCARGGLSIRRCDRRAGRVAERAPERQRRRSDGSIGDADTVDRARPSASRRERWRVDRRRARARSSSTSSWSRHACALQWSTSRRCAPRHHRPTRSRATRISDAAKMRDVRYPARGAPVKETISRRAFANVARNCVPLNLQTTDPPCRDTRGSRLSEAAPTLHATLTAPREPRQDRPGAPSGPSDPTRIPENRLAVDDTPSPSGGSLSDPDSVSSTARRT